MIQHPLQNLRVVTLPVVQLADDAQRMAGAVGLCGVPANAVASSAPQAAVSTSAVK